MLCHLRFADPFEIAKLSKGGEPIVKARSIKYKVGIISIHGLSRARGGVGFQH